LVVFGIAVFDDAIHIAGRSLFPGIAVAVLFLAFQACGNGDSAATTTLTPSASPTSIPSPTETPTPQEIINDSSNSLFFLRRDGDIYTLPAGGGIPAKFSEGDACTADTLDNTWKLDWSPAGDLIACSGTDGDTALTLVLFDEAGNVFAQTRIAPIPHIGCGPQWSPDGRWITYRTDNAKEITLTVLDTHLQVHGRLTDTDISLPPFVAAGRPWPCWPAWSPDGSTIAYLETTSREVHLYLPDTGEDTVVIAGDYKPLAWRNASEIFVAADFSVDEGGFASYKIFVLDTESGSLERVLALESGPGSPEEGINRQGWVSPDGRYVALLSHQTGSELQGIGIYNTQTGSFNIIAGSNVSYPSDFIPPSYVWFSSDSSQVFWWDHAGGVFSAPSHGAGSITSVAPFHAEGISNSPLYSQDLKSAVHIEFRAGGREVILTAADGSGAAMLASLLWATGEQGAVVAWNPVR
jgi:Tol biopolymer transport system component